MFRWNNSVFACTLMWFVLCQSPNSLGILVQNRWSPCIGLHLKDKLTIDKRRSLYLCPTGKLTVDRRTLCVYPQDKLIVDKRSSCFFRLTLSETPNALLEKTICFRPCPLGTWFQERGLLYFEQCAAKWNQGTVMREFETICLIPIWELPFFTVSLSCMLYESLLFWWHKVTISHYTSYPVPDRRQTNVPMRKMNRRLCTLGEWLCSSSCRACVEPLSCCHCCVSLLSQYIISIYLSV